MPIRDYRPEPLVTTHHDRFGVRNVPGRTTKVRKTGNLARVTIHSPVGRSTAEGRARRAAQSAEYRAELERRQPYEDIARQVIRLRMDRRLSQTALARRVGTTKSAISRLESGQHASTVETLRKIAAAFGGHLVVTFDVPDAPLQATGASVSV